MFGAPGEFHHPGLGLGLGLRFRVTVRVSVRVRVRVNVRDRVRLRVRVRVRDRDRVRDRGGEILRERPDVRYCVSTSDNTVPKNRGNCGITVLNSTVKPTVLVT